MGMTCRKPTSEPTKACLYIAYDPTPSPLTLALTFTARIPTEAFAYINQKFAQPLKVSTTPSTL